MVHIGIIPDGNRRWCKNNNKKLDDLIDWWINKMIFPNIKTIIKNPKLQKKLKYFTNITLYISSIDNFNRSDKSYELSWKLIEKLYFLFKDFDEFSNKENNIFTTEELSKLKEFSINTKLNIVGNLDLIPENIQTILNEVKNLMNGNKIIITIAIAYDPKKDIENTILKNNEFYNRNQPNIDLIYRSGNERRTSGFFPYQSLYSELYFEKKLWPDININDIIRALNSYQRRNRRFGL